MIDVRGLTEEEVEEMRRLAIEKRDYYERFLAKLERAIGRSPQAELPISTGEDRSKPPQNGEVISRITGVMSSSRWMGNQEIRIAIKTQTGVDLNRNVLREHLSKGEGVYFQRRGNRGGTEWKLMKP